MDGLPLTRSTTSGTAAAISRFFALVSRGGIRWPASTLPGRSYHLRSHSYPPPSSFELAERDSYCQYYRMHVLQSRHQSTAKPHTG